MAVLLISSLFIVIPVEAQPLEQIIVTLSSPGIGATYNSNTLTSQFSVTWLQNDMTIVKSMAAICYIDGQPQGQTGLTIINRVQPEVASASGSITLSSLSQGEHRIEIKGKATVGFTIMGGELEVDFSSDTISFSINLIPVVSVSNLREYQAGQVGLNITTDKVGATVSYSLDNLANVTLPQTEAIQIGSQYQYTVTFSGLSDGMHILNAYATDSFGNTGSTIANFTINTVISTPTEKPTTQPTQITSTVIIVGAAIVGAVMVSVALLVIYRKPKIKKIT
jgi:hypothetical protein